MAKRFGLSSFVFGLLLLPVPLLAQGTVLTGQVTAGNRGPLSDVGVTIPELGVGSFTREGGRYTITVPSARATGQTVTLTARRIGYRVQSVRIALTPGTITQNFVLGENPLQLGEIIVTGAGTTSTIERLGNVRNVVAPELIVKSNEANVVQALAGKAPNVVVSQTAGDPGANSRIQIRGLRTLNGNVEPLFVIDGVPVTNYTFSTTNFNPIDAGGGGVGGQDNGGQFEGTSAPNRMIDVNTDDIENVEILKGAAAAAIYGARAANGVILITTKHGHSGGTRYQYRSSYSTDEVTREYPLQNSWSLGRFNLSALPCENIGKSTCTRSWGPRLATGTPVYDHATEAFRNGHVADNTLTVSGGNDRTTFFLSGGVMKNNGVFVGPNNYFNRSTVRLNASHQLSSTLQVGGNFSYADTRGHFTQRGNNVNGLLLGLFRTPPEFNNLPYLDPKSGLHRSYRLQNPAPTTAAKSRGFNNPFFTLNEELNDGQAARSFGNVTADYHPFTWLKFSESLGADYTSDERLEGCPAECSDVAAGGRITEGKVVNYQIDHSLTGTANFTFSDALGANLSIGQNLNARNNHTLSVVGRTLIASTPFSLLNTLTQDRPSDYQTQVHNSGYFGQLQLDILKQLYLTTAVRDDCSTTFGRSNKCAVFPKTSAAWTFTNAVHTPGLSYGKLRFSHGEAGNEPQPYLSSVTFSGTNLVGGIAQGTGFTPTQSGRGGLFFNATKPANALKPERTRETEAGFDIGFFGDGADLSATWYKSKTNDVILITPIPPSSGYSSEAKNAGKLRNSGTELQLNLRPFTRPNRSWDIGIGWANNHSQVDTLVGAQFLYIPSSFTGNVFMIGKPIGVIRGEGWVRCGISPNSAIDGVDLASVCAGKPKGALFIDDGTHCYEKGMPCEDTELRILGDPNPKWTGNVHSTVRFGKFALSGLVDIKKGGVVWNGTKGALWSYGTHRDTENRATCTGPTNSQCTGNVHAFGDSDWFPGSVVGPGAGAKIPIGENWYRNSGLAACPFTGIDEPCMEDGGYVKLREISIAYSFTQPWVARSFGMTSIDFRVSGRNLKTWTKYTGLDPETTTGQAYERVGGSDYFNLPLTRSVVFTLTLNR